MRTGFERKISAIVKNNNRLEFIINKLTEKTVARHDISVQDTVEDLKHNSGYMAKPPEDSQNEINPEKKEAFMQDDFGWVLGFSFSLPLFICLIVSIFIIGDVRSINDNILYGVLGTIVGIILGAITAKLVATYQGLKIKKQEKKGGFALWITAHSLEQSDEIVALLKQYNASNIKVEELNA